MKWKVNEISLQNVKWRPQRDLNPCYHLERVMSLAGLDDGDTNVHTLFYQIEPRRDRTGDPLLKRQMLYRLS